MGFTAVANGTANLVLEPRGYHCGNVLGESRVRNPRQAQVMGGKKVPGSRSPDQQHLSLRLRQTSGLRPKLACAAASDLPDAILFDCDGVLVDTEKDGHRVAFNEAFKQKGLSHEWSVDLYGKLLETGGGKERMLKYFSECEDQEPFKTIKTLEERAAFVKELHLLKTDIFMSMVESGAMPLRPGVKRLVGEAIGRGVPVAVCSTSNERAVSSIVKVLLGAEVAEHMRVFAGDVVAKKKPSPDIYQLAAKELRVDPSRCVVVEDSKIGEEAAKSAGMRCVVTKSSYTQNEDFSQADAIFDCIGDRGDDGFSLDDLCFRESGALKVSMG